jgi:hypothetical protein
MTHSSRGACHPPAQDAPTHFADECGSFYTADAVTSDWIPPEQGATLSGDSRRLDGEWLSAAVAMTRRPALGRLRRLPLLRRLGSRIARTFASPPAGR